MLDLHVDWRCPACGLTDRTQGNVANRMHHCPKMGGLVTPFVREGVAAKVEMREREDHVNGETGLRYANGKAVMSIVTTRDNGQDTTVFAPTATARGDA